MVDPQITTTDLVHRGRMAAAAATDSAYAVPEARERWKREHIAWEMADEIERLRARLDALELHSNRDVVAGWIAVPAVEWDQAMEGSANDR